MLKKLNSNQIGHKGEDDAFAFLKELLSKLGFVPIKARKQKSGTQQGKDLLYEWYDGEQQITWHFEVKSQQTQIDKKEILVKLEDARKSGYMIDCWCLVAFYNDPSNDLDNFIEESNNNTDYAFYIDAWSPATYIKEHIYLISKDLYKRIYGAKEPAPSNMTVDSFKKNITTVSVKGRKAKENWPNDFEKRIINSRNKPDEIAKAMQSAFVEMRENTDFLVDNVNITAESTTAHIKPREGKSMHIGMKLKLDPERAKEYQELMNMRKKEMLLNEDEVQDLSAVVGNTSLLKDGEKFKVQITNKIPRLPVIGISCSDNGRKYAGLQHIRLEHKGIENGEVQWNNLSQNPSVRVAMEVSKDGLSFKKTSANRESPDYTIEDELGSIDFTEDLMLGKEIVLTDKEKNKVIARGRFIPTNIDVGDTLDAVDDYRKILKMIRTIRDYSGIELRIPTSLSREQFSDIKRIHRAIIEKEIMVRMEGANFTLPKKEVIDEVMEEKIHDELALEINPYKEELFGVDINLGRAQLDFTKVRVTQTPEGDNVKITLNTVDKDSHTIIKFPDIDH